MIVMGASNSQLSSHASPESAVPTATRSGYGAGWSGTAGPDKIGVSRAIEVPAPTIGGGLPGRGSVLRLAEVEGEPALTDFDGGELRHRLTGVGLGGREPTEDLIEPLDLQRLPAPQRP